MPMLACIAFMRARRFRLSRRNFPASRGAARSTGRRLAAEVAGKPERLKQLESIVHPMVVRAEIDFLRGEEKKGAALAVLEIPLLFETGAEKRVDVTIVLSAPHHVQRARVLARPGMTVDRLEHLLARQLPDAEKRARADYVVDSGTGLADMNEQIDKLIESLRGRQGRVMERLRHQ